jgi:hypothetical protein
MISTLYTLANIKDMSTISVDEETKKRVIQRRKAGVNMRNISKEFHLSFTTINKIWKEGLGQKEPKPQKSDHAKAFQLFSLGKTPTQVAIKVDLSYDTVKTWYFEYLSLNNQSNFVNVLYQYPEFLPFFVDIAQKMKRGELFKEEVNYLLANMISCRASQQRKEWLDHDVRCLEARKKNLLEEVTSMEDNKKSRLSDDSSRFGYLSEDF